MSTVDRYFSSCPYCSSFLSGEKNGVNLQTVCPTCGYSLNVSCGENVVLTPNLNGETFTENGFIVKNGVLEKYNGLGKIIKIPNGVVAIGAFVFKDRADVKEIIIPKGVQHVLEGAFCGCEGLRTITLPNGVKTLSSSSFKNCRRLEIVNVPESVVAMGIDVFYGCSNLKVCDIPMNAKFVASSPFPYCKKLIRMNVPHCVEELSHWFVENNSLESVVFGKSVRWIERVDCPKLTSAKFYKTEGWEIFKAVFEDDGVREYVDSNVLKDEKKAALLLKRYAKNYKRIYIPK